MKRVGRQLRHPQRLPCCTTPPPAFSDAACSIHDRTHFCTFITFCFFSCFFVFFFLLSHIIMLDVGRVSFAQRVALLIYYCSSRVAWKNPKYLSKACTLAACVLAFCLIGLECYMEILSVQSLLLGSSAVAGPYLDLEAFRIVVRCYFMLFVQQQ